MTEVRRITNGWTYDAQIGGYVSSYYWVTETGDRIGTEVFRYSDSPVYLQDLDEPPDFVQNFGDMLGLLIGRGSGAMLLSG